jgi:hypothetical protein
MKAQTRSRQKPSLTPLLSSLLSFPPPRILRALTFSPARGALCAAGRFRFRYRGRVVLEDLLPAQPLGRVLVHARPAVTRSAAPARDCEGVLIVFLLLEALELDARRVRG